MFDLHLFSSKLENWDWVLSVKEPKATERHNYTSHGVDSKHCSSFSCSHSIHLIYPRTSQMQFGASHLSFLKGESSIMMNVFFTYVKTTISHQKNNAGSVFKNDLFFFSYFLLHSMLWVTLSPPQAISIISFLFWMNHYTWQVAEKRQRTWGTVSYLDDCSQRPIKFVLSYAFNWLYIIRNNKNKILLWTEKRHE